MLIRNLSCIVLVSLFVGTALTGCHHSAGGSSTVAPGGSDAAALGGSTTEGGIAVTYFSDDQIRQIPADSYLKDPSVGEKIAVHFISSINSGNTAAVKLKRGDPEEQIAYHVKADGRITDITFMQFVPGTVSAQFIGMMTFADKKKMHFMIDEDSKDQRQTDEKLQKDYMNGNWHVSTILDLSNNSDTPEPLR